MSGPAPERTLANSAAGSSSAGSPLDDARRDPLNCGRRQCRAVACPDVFQAISPWSFADGSGGQQGRRMLLKFEHRLSDSPFVERVWRAHSTAAGSFHSMAEPNLELVVARVDRRAMVILRGPGHRASQDHHGASVYTRHHQL